MKTILLILVMFALAACDTSTPEKPKPVEKVTDGQIIGALMHWDWAVVSQATDSQVNEFLFGTLFFGGAIIGGIWFGLIRGIATLIRAYRAPHVEPENEDDDE